MVRRSASPADAVPPAVASPSVITRPEPIVMFRRVLVMAFASEDQLHSDPHLGRREPGPGTGISRLMTPERWQQVERTYRAALGHPAPERANAVAELCAGDEALRQEVETLLAQTD